MTRIALTVGLTMLALAAASCEQPKPSQPGSPQVTVTADPNRDSAQARQANLEGTRLLAQGRPVDARKEFEKAIAADPFYGAAHNNLGTIHEMQKRFYQAALSYQQAAKLMPNRPEPLNNLGLIREKTNRLDDAVKAYEEAMRLAPDNPEITANLVRVYVRMGRRDQKVKDMLAEVFARDERPAWQHWARELLVRTNWSQTQPATRPTIITVPGGRGNSEPRPATVTPLP